jgi:glycosyltransferase involved in cell wall biosynthesis
MIMAKILILTTDLPYFPGKMGVDFFNLRHLARNHGVAVLAPCYDSFPEQGVANLEAFLSQAYFWPRPADEVPLVVSAAFQGQLKSWFGRLPRRVRWWILKRLLRIHDQPHDAFNKLAILANCAPQLLSALSHGQWIAMALIQTSIEPWLDYLPASGAKLVYFHDVRSDYLEREIPLPGEIPKARKEINAIRRQEQRVSERADVVGFVSELDHQRAQRIFRMKAEAGVAPIPVDTDYYVPRPHDWKRDPRSIVLFTGHLSHPPNVDALLFFLREIWPRMLLECPQAIFQAVGMVPAPSVVAEMQTSTRCELHANVPDIRPYFWNARVYVVPMRYGGGVRQKLFEAWSMRVPVVCTTMAAEGTGAENATHCWLEDTPANFARRIATVLQLPDEAPMVQAAKIQVERHNSIACAAPEFQALVERAIHVRKRRPFKLLYDLRWMELGKAGGMEQATYELLSALSQLDRRNAYRIFAPRSACTEWDFPAGFQVKRHYSDPVSRQSEVARSFLANKLAEGIGMYPLLTPHMRSLAAYHKLDFDIVHSVAGYTHPDMLGFPGVLTINDLQHLHYPQFFSMEEYEERERLYRESAERATHIICISEFTRQDVHRQYGIPLEKMSTVWIIPSRNVWQPLSESARAALLAGMQLTAPFFFFPAHCWLHKNHAKLIEAFQRIASELPPDIKLVMTGNPFPENHPAAILIRENNLYARVKHLGYRSPLEVRALFQGCLALVFPSLFEGYGMPVAEAIIAGKPVLCSNATSLPEVAGEAALTFDPNSVEEIATSLLNVATKPELRLALTEAAKRRRPSFSARRSAIQTMSIYQRVHNEFYSC